MAKSQEIITAAVEDAIRNGRSFHDYWYYTLDHLQRVLFSGFQEFERRCDDAYRNALKAGAK